MENKIFKYLEKLQHGYLVVKTPCGNEIDIGDSALELHADISINDWAVIDLVLSKGALGLGQAYIRGLFCTSNLPNLLTLLALNQKILEPIAYTNIFHSIFFTLKNLLKKNSLKGSRKNIEYHYDLGNNFYSLWLDETMSYSSGIFDGDCSLHDAQKNKYNRILSQLNQTGSQVLEIGCGWGGFINEANHKFSVKGLTLSHEQKKYADDLIVQRGIKSYVALQDYRLESEKFDNIVSIEMFEAVGRQYWDNYFAKINECLKPDGRAVIQTITIGDDFYSKYLKTSDYIREYIFPGGFLPSPRIFHNLASQNGLQVVDEFCFADSYAKTLLKWLDNFDNVTSKVLNLGYSPEFIRKWRFYLAYCVAGFASGRTDVIQYTLSH